MGGCGFEMGVLSVMDVVEGGPLLVLGVCCRVNGMCWYMLCTMLLL